MSGQVYTNIAEAIYDFSLHRVNRMELFEIISNCVLESTNEDKEMILAPKKKIRTNYDVAKDWLNKK